MMKRIIFFLVATLLISSCGKRLIYFKQKKESKNSYTNIKVATPVPTREHIIQEGDLLQIRLFDADPKVLLSFNREVTDESKSTAGFQVRNNGAIFIPYAGNVNVKGLSLDQAQQVVSDSLSRFITAPSLILDLVGFQVTVLGEVNRPGPVLIPSDKASIINLLALSGDISQYGNPNNIKVVRETDGVTQVHFLDLTDVDVFMDPYFYVASNDVIYVESLPRKFVQQNLTAISLFTAIINTLIIVSLTRAN